MTKKRYNLKRIKEIAGGDQNFVMDMLVTFVENVSNEVERTLSLRPSENWTVIAEVAHKLASNFAYLGAQSLHALAADIEKSILCDDNLIGIAEKVDQMCDESILLVNQIKNDFQIESNK